MMKGFFFFSPGKRFFGDPLFRLAFTALCEDALKGEGASRGPFSDRLKVRMDWTFQGVV